MQPFVPYIIITKLYITPGIFECEIASSPVRKSSGYSAKKYPITSAYTKYVSFLIQNGEQILFARNRKLQ